MLSQEHHLSFSPPPPKSLNAALFSLKLVVAPLDSAILGISSAPSHVKKTARRKHDAHPASGRGLHGLRFSTLFEY